MNLTKQQIGDILKELRISSGFSQKDVADHLGRRQQIISHWETGYTQPDANTLFELCEFYGADISASFGFSGNRVKLSKGEAALVLAYRKASADDKNIVDSALRKYTNAPRLTLVASHNGGLSTADSSAINQLGLEMQEDDSDL